MKKLLLALYSALAMSGAVAQTSWCTYCGAVPPDSWYSAPDQKLPEVNTRGGGNATNANDLAALDFVVKTVINYRIAQEQAEAMAAYRERYPNAFTHQSRTSDCTAWREVVDRFGRSFRERICD